MDPTYCEFELGSLDSESKVLTVTPWDLFVLTRKIFKYIKALRNCDVLTIRGRDGIVPERVPLPREERACSFSSPTSTVHEPTTREQRQGSENEKRKR